MTTGRQADPALVKRIEACLREPIYFRDILDATRNTGRSSWPGATSARAMPSNGTSTDATGVPSGPDLAEGRSHVDRGMRAVVVCARKGTII